MNRYILSFIIFSIPVIIFAQQRPISELLNDANRSSTKNILKTDLSEYLRANIPLIWEHRFNNNLSILSGAGLLTHKFLRPVLIPNNNSGKRTFNEKLNGGYSLFLEPRFYYDGFESFHFGFPLKFRNHINQAVSYEVTISCGRQWFLTRRISFDFDFGIGLNFEKSLDDKSYIFDSNINNVNLYGGEGMRFVLPLSIKFGFVL